MKSKVGFFYQNESWKQKLNKMFSILELPLWLQMTLLCLQPWTRAMPLPLVSALGSHHHHIFRKRAAPVHALCPHCNKLFPLSSHDQISEKVLAHFRTLDSYASRSLEQERRWKKNKETRGRTRDISREKKNVKVIFFMDYSAWRLAFSSMRENEILGSEQTLPTGCRKFSAACY